MADLKNNIVAKHNKLIQTRYMMTVAEQRLLLACISQVNSLEKLKKDKSFILTIDQAQDMFYSNGNLKNVYRDMEEASRRLFDRKIEIVLDNKRTLLTRFVQSIIFNQDDYSITIKFAEDIIPYLSLLNSNFTQYKLENIAQLTSEHAIRLYELIVCWAGLQENFREMTITEFKEMLGIEDKYKQIGELKRFVIEKAVNQINENTDYKLTVELKKRRRSFHWIQLFFERKPEAIKAEQERKALKKQRKQHNEKAKAKRLAEHSDKELKALLKPNMTLIDKKGAKHLLRADLSLNLSPEYSYIFNRVGIVSIDSVIKAIQQGKLVIQESI